MVTRVAINGFGRIGRAFIRAVLSHPSDQLDIVAVNDLTDPANLAYLLSYDSAYGHLQTTVEATEDGLKIGDKLVKVLAEKDPTQLPWQAMGVDLVIESTGFFTKRDGAAKHLEAGAKKVLISAPAKNPDATIVMGVNDNLYDPNSHHIISNASCTTNCLAPVAKVLLDTFGLKNGFLTTVHAYTATQGIVDRPDAKDFRRGRAAAVSIVPSSTGAATAVALVIPELKGKLDGLALRVPTLTGSIVDFVIQTEKSVSVESINAAFKAAATGPMKGILGIAHKGAVSADIVGNPLSSIVESESTMVLGDSTAKVLSWYDNECGYAHRVRDLAVLVASQL